MKLKIFLILSFFSFAFSNTRFEFINNKGELSKIDCSILIESKEIQDKVKEYGKVISEEYKNEPITLVMIMKGSVCFAVDLLYNLPIDTSVECIDCSSYGMGTTSGELKINGLDELDIEGRNVLLIDDICDSGKTLKNVSKKLKEKNPKSLKTIVLLKRDNGKESIFTPDYALFNLADDAFVVGYGLDYGGKFRGLRDIYSVISID